MYFTLSFRCDLHFLLIMLNFHLGHWLQGGPIKDFHACIRIQIVKDLELLCHMVLIICLHLSDSFVRDQLSRSIFGHATGRSLFFHLESLSKRLRFPPANILCP